jgi:hypothetical protein
MIIAMIFDGRPSDSLSGPIGDIHTSLDQESQAIMPRVFRKDNDACNPIKIMGLGYVFSGDRPKEKAASPVSESKQKRNYPLL